MATSRLPKLAAAGPHPLAGSDWQHSQPMAGYSDTVETATEGVHGYVLAVPAARCLTGCHAAVRWAVGDHSTPDSCPAKETGQSYSFP